MKRLFLLAPLLLTACDTRPAHAEWQNVCVASHDEGMMMPQTMVMSDGRGGTTTMTTMQWMPNIICDRYERQCRPGRDGSTVCRK